MVRRCIYMNKLKEFFSDGIDTIIKMLVTQLGMTMFGIMITMTARIVPQFAKQERNPLVLAASCAAVAFYMFLLYIHTWDKGARDKIRIDGGRLEYCKIKGLYYSLVANSINLLLGLVMCATYYFCDFANNTPSSLCQIFGIANDIARLIQGMYIGILNYISPDAISTPPILFIAITFPALAISTLGYYLGSTNRKITKLFKNK